MWIAHFAVFRQSFEAARSRWSGPAVGRPFRRLPAVSLLPVEPCRAGLPTRGSLLNDTSRTAWTTRRAGPRSSLTNLTRTADEARRVVSLHRSTGPAMPKRKVAPDTEASGAAAGLWGSRLGGTRKPVSDPLLPSWRVPEQVAEPGTPARPAPGISGRRRARYRWHRHR